MICLRRLLEQEQEPDPSGSCSLPCVLSVSTYVEAKDTREKIDIVKLNAEIKEIVAREQMLRDEIDKIIAESRCKMVVRLVQDIREALENELYFVALSSALTLPDICGKAAYPDERSSRKRYISWYDEKIGKYEKNPEDKDDMPYLSGEVIYSLRCSLLHEGNPNMKNDNLRTNQPIDHFSLVIEKVKPVDIYLDASTITRFGNEQKREYRMNVRRICMILCNMAESYFRDNRDKFHFNYEIIDWDKVTSHLPPIDREKVFAELAKSGDEFYRGRKMGENE